MTRARDLSRLSNSNAFSVDATNRVGIGSTVPRADLDVTGRVLIGNDISIQSGIITATTFSGNITGVAATFTGNVSIAGTLTYEDVTNIDSVGLITARSGVVLTGGNVTLGTGVTASGSTANTFTLSTNGSERLRVDSSGRLGLGTSSPSSLLHLSVATAASDGTKGVRITNPAGTAAMFECGSSNDSYVGTTSDSHFSIRTNNTSRIYVTSGGSVGVGTISPQARLHINAATNENILVTSAGSGDLRIGAFNDAISATVQLSLQGNPLLFRGAGGAEVGRWDTSGRLLVGTTSTSGNATVHINKGVAAGTDGAGILLSNNGAMAGVGVNDILGYINFGGGTTGFTTYNSASITAQADATWSSASDVPSRLVFATTSDGASSPTERMRITHSGAVGIGITAPQCRLDLGTGYGSSGEKFFIYNDDASSPLGGTKMGFYIDRFSETNSISLVFPYTAGQTNRFHVAYKATNGTTITDVCYVTHNSTSWTFPSDERIKNVEGPITNALDILSGIRPVYYSFKKDEQKRRKVGMIAQDWLKQLPEVVEVPDAEFDFETGQGQLGLSSTDTIAVLVAAIKELKEEVNALKSQLL